VCDSKGTIDTTHTTMVQGIMIFLLNVVLISSIFLVHSTLIDPTLPDPVFAPNQASSSIILDLETAVVYGQNNDNNNVTTIREMQREGTPFTFQFNPNNNNVSSCKGRQAKRLQRRYNQQFAIWNATKPSCYTYSLERVCFKCPLTPVQVSVQGGVVTSTVPPPILPEDGDEPAPTMDDLFATLRGCIYDCQEEYIHQCRVRFSKSRRRGEGRRGRGRGIITGVYMDEVQELTDDETEIHVRNFKEC
jgi:Family of unknown function (DUF6174)